ncbi:uncharacterized protein K441DRAFT_652915 [Cenococcum geophilum 1.58]|uniref:uncharacterized protein n=1 Tax=Cenococcum geophilum 1.58 TaxID=794803 RepID=UPI00358E9802|nr:hypothetical protein K441DRAFT_652915 [Cenococcum geophilum 1.58]
MFLFIRSSALSSMMNCIKTKWSKSPDTWFAEASALCISVCALAGIYGLLKHYNGKPVVAWHQVTLNAAVSTLATLARTLMLLAVASCLGQCKWIWFNKQLEPLPDFELINEAARGPSGASRLLLRTILKATLRPKLLTSVVTIGCSVTLLALAFDPTIQQIVSSDQTIFYAKNESTEVPLAHRWSDAYIANTFLGVLNNEFRYWDDIVSGNKAHVKFGTQAAIMTGLTANSDNITQQLRLSCDSGHCRWEKYQSLAVCSRCEDISSNVTKGNRSQVADLAALFRDPNGVQTSTNITWYLLPHGLNINNPNDYTVANGSKERITMTGQANWNAGHTIKFKNSSTLLATMSLLWADLDENDEYPDWPNANIKATECGLYLCVKEFQTNMTNGTISETSKEISSSRDPSSYLRKKDGPQDTDYHNLLDNPLDVERTDLEIKMPDGSPPHEPFRMNQAGVCGLIYYVAKAFDDGTLWLTKSNETSETIYNVQILKGINGMARLMPDKKMQFMPDKKMQFMPEIMEIFWENREGDGLSTLFANIAASLTNNIRMTSDNQSSRLSGEEGKPTFVFKIRWVWIIPTVVSIILAIIFLLLVICLTNKSNTPVWKGSTLAMLFHGLSVDVKRSIPPQILQSETDKGAKHVLVELREKDEGLCLSGPTTEDGADDPRMSHLYSTSSSTAENSVMESLLKLTSDVD